ncbi:hypothetical protein LPTSP4_14370 [Leptospira ryugenii]|uniref:Uncharacterized protein n=1 Tax=Leptospira ryugenii TaxID=1917863 RepID=A0A2P2DZ62_9LEPT|nr:hypothetical protein [Leptospira ryugenii]GBF49917.1 hypothetical protein LPTSP4_14370 [Leptospira ryugenii]
MSEAPDSQNEPFAWSREASASDPEPKHEAKVLVPILELPKNRARFSPSSLAILEELRVRHRRMEMHGSAEISPSTLLTVDQIPEVLHKEVQLPETHKTQMAISEALIELSDSRNHFQERAVYFYPFFLRTETGISIRIAMMAPQNKDKMDMTPYRRACFKYSLDLFGIVYKNLSNQEPFLDDKNPGKSLLSRDANGNLFLDSFFYSLERDIKHITERGFSPYFSFEIPDFTQDFIQFGKENKLILEIDESYHIVVPANNPVEILKKHLVAQLDGLMSFSAHYLVKFIKEHSLLRFLDIWEDLEKKIGNQKESLLSQTWVLADDLVRFIKEFPFPEDPTVDWSRVQETAERSASVLERLLAEIQKKGKDIAEEKYREFFFRMKTKILDHTSKQLRLLKINLLDEISEIHFANPEEKESFSVRLMNDIKSMFGAVLEKNEFDQWLVYAIDQRYLRDVEANVQTNLSKDPDAFLDQKRLTQIREELTKRKDSQLDVLSETIPQASSEAEETQAEDKSNNLQTKGGLLNQMHLPSGLIVAMAGSFGSTLTSLFTNQMEILFQGVLLSLVSGFTVSYLYPYFLPKKEALTKSSASHLQSIERNMGLHKAIESVLFPKKYSQIFERVFDTKKLRFQLEEKMDEILSLLPNQEKQKDRRRLLNDIESAAAQITIMIRIPETLLVRGRSREFIVSKNDMKTVVFRDKLSEHFRKEASVYKSDPDMMAYLNFIIKEIDFGYTKYLK